MDENKTYPRDSAGRVMVQKVPTFGPGTKISDAIKKVTGEANTYDTINYIYVVASDEKLRGVVSIRNLLSTPVENQAQELAKIMNSTVITVRPHSHQERAAQLALKYNIKAVPVTDKDNNFLGVINSDQILSIMHEEKVEDLLKFVGISNRAPLRDDVMALSVTESLLHRLPWLAVGLLGGLIIAQTIRAFEHTLQENLIIAAFIPLMVYMSNAVGQQLMAFLVRDSALNDKIPYGKYFAKQASIVLVIAVLISLILFGLSAVLYGDITTAKVLGLAMFSTVLSALFTGFGVPFALMRFKLDPANASGPMGTMFQDFLSVLIYFLIVSALL